MRKLKPAAIRSSNCPEVELMQPAAREAAFLTVWEADAPQQC